MKNSNLFVSEKLNNGKVIFHIKKIDSLVRAMKFFILKFLKNV